MRLCVFIEPQQGAAHADQLLVALRAEECGFDGFFRSDHYLTMGSRSGLPGPTDSWVTLGALAVQTSRIRLGTLVSSATFRHPGVLAISVAQVDAMSGGRVDLGLGAGWFEGEHRAYGIPFPPMRERFDRLAEQLEIITGLWSATDPFTFRGGYYDVYDSPGLPKPVQSPYPPVIIGGKGKRRTAELAARFADEYNVAFASPETVRECFAAVAAACGRVDRDGAGRAPLVLSVALTVCCGQTDAEVRRRMEAAGTSMEWLRGAGLVGTPGEVADQIRAYAELGVSRMFLQVLDLADLDHLDLIAAEVAPALGP